MKNKTRKKNETRKSNLQGAQNNLCPMKLPSQCGQQMTKKAHKRYAVQHATVIITEFLQHLSNRFPLRGV